MTQVLRKFKLQQPFRTMGIGETFLFASEGGVYSKAAGGVLQWQGARGPWVKLSARTYSHIDDPKHIHRVGSINVEVKPFNNQPE